MFGFQSFSEAPYSTVGGAVAKLGSASITGVGTVVADALRVRTSAGSISATTTVTADGLKILLGSGSITSTALLTALGGLVNDASGCYYRSSYSHR
jgi:hypothetical protein